MAEKDPILQYPNAVVPQAPPTPIMSVEPTASMPSGPEPAPTVPPPAEQAPTVEPPLQPLGTVPVQQPSAGNGLPPTMTLAEGQTKQGLKVDPAIESTFKRGVNNIQDAAALTTEADVAAANAKAQSYSKIADAEKEIYDKWQVNQTVRENQQALLDKKIEDRRAKAEAQIDPNRYWNSLSDGRKAVAMISLVLSSFGAAFTGTRNTALDMLNKAVDDDVNAQRADIATAQAADAKDAASIRGLMDQGMSEREATLMRMKMTRSALEAQLEGKLAATRDQALQGNLRKLIGESQIEGAKIDLALAKDKQDQKVTAWKQVPLVAGGEGQSKQDEEKRKWVSEFRQMTADEKSPGGRYLATVRDKEDFESFLKGGAPSTAIMNFIATGLKQGSFGAALKEMADSPSTFDAAVEALRKRIAGGERPAFLQNISRSLEIKRMAARSGAKDLIDGMREHGINDRMLLGTPSRENELADAGMTREK